MTKVKALKEFINGGTKFFEKDEELEVKKFADRFFITPKKSSNKILIPEGFVEEIEEK